jgi:iron(III) transport system permease protein
VVIGFSFMIFSLTVQIPIYGTIWIITLALVTKYIAYTTGTMIAAQMQLAGELEEASLIAGASQIVTYCRIVLPLLAPAIINCALWVLIHAIRELAIAIMLYSPTAQVLSTEVWSLWQGGMIAQLCALGVLTISVLILFLSLPWLFRTAHRFTRRLRPALTHSRLDIARRQ